MMNKIFEGLSFVFDIDDTICDNKNRDYENAIPFNEVIDKINYLYDNGAKITLYTSRGMVSCNGDLAKIIAKNKDVLERWLSKNNVRYTELVFGKPLGDLYVDDKAMNVREFVNQEFKELSGHSGYRVVRIGNMVRKEMSEENFKKLSQWYQDSKGIAYSPRIISKLYTTMYLEYIDGESGNKAISKQLLEKIIKQILDFKEVRYDSFNKDKVIEKIDKHKSNDESWNAIVEECKKMVAELDLEKHASLSHYDMTLANIVVKDNKLYLLDSLYDKEASSYLLDFAKLKMSLDGYEEYFCGGDKISKEYSKMLVEKLKELGIYREVLILEFMWTIRLYNYNQDKEKVKRFVKERRNEID